MTFLQFLIDFFVKTGGFIIAGLSIYLMWKSRISSYRDILYTKQLEGYMEIAKAMDKITFTLFAVKEKKKKQYLFDRKMDFNEIFYKWRHILPAQLVSQFVNFSIQVVNASKNMDEGSDLHLDSLVDIVKKISVTAQEYFGIEPLSLETKDLIMKLSNPA